MGQDQVELKKTAYDRLRLIEDYRQQLEIKMEKHRH